MVQDDIVGQASSSIFVIREWYMMSGLKGSRVA
jgi:hypothetical protein